MCLPVYHQLPTNMYSWICLLNDIGPVTGLRSTGYQQKYKSLETFMLLEMHLIQLTVVRCSDGGWGTVVLWEGLRQTMIADSTMNVYSTGYRRLWKFTMAS